MKKLFFLAATLCGAMAMNAASFTGFDAFDGKLGDRITTMVTDLSNASMSLTKDAEPGKYSIFADTAGTEGSFKIGGIKFAYTDANAHKEIVKTYNGYIQPNGSRRIITIPTSKDDKVYIYVTADQEITSTEITGVVETITEFSASECTELTATGTSIVIQTTSKPKYAAILPNKATGLMEATAAPAEVKKVIIDGKLFIRNAAGELVSVLGF